MGKYVLRGIVPMKKYLDKSLSVQERAEALVDEMTVNEMAGQLRYDAPAIERLGIPSYNWWNEGLHGLARSGVATMFPQAIGLAATFDTDLVKQVGDITSTECRAKYNEYQAYGDTDIYKGLTIWAPNINIFRDPRWGRGHETYGEDPYLTTECGKAYVKGLQGDGDVLKTAACAKHMAVHSGPENLRHEFDAIATPKDMEETYLPAFEALVKDAKVESVMGAYNRVNGQAACANDLFMSKLNEWGFDGYFVSDCWAVRDFHEHHGLTGCPTESVALALKSGCDVNCGCTYQHILSALEMGLISEDDIKRACVHAMRTRIRLGMFDDSTEFDKIPYEVVACKEHKAVSLDAAQKSMVMLKNNGVLPLSDSVKTIAVIGPNSDSKIALEGNYNGTSDRYTTFLTGIQDRFEGRVIFAEGCHLYKDRCSNLAQANDRLAEAVAAAKHADVSVLCLGLDSTIEGEEGDTGNEFSSGDKNDIRLPQSQRILLAEILKLGKPVIVVCAAGSAINIEADVDALIHAWYPGAEGGKALAQILFGDVSPSAKLPVTFYTDTDKLPDFTDYSMAGRTYRYCTDNVLYPFGYGLSYAKTKYSDLSYADFTATVSVENKSDIACEEVIELYIKDYCKDAVTNYSLCGFKRIKLNAGEKVTTTVALNPLCFTSVDDNGVRAVRSDKYTLYAGSHQPDELSCKLSGSACISVDINL